MIKSGKYRKIVGIWVKITVWVVVLTGLVILQSGAFRATEVEASIQISATINDPTVEKVSPATGPVTGNTSVTISGTNFTNVIAVTLGGVNVRNFTIESDTLITALTAPGQPGAVKVVVITEDKAGALENGFTYVAQAAAPTSTVVPTPTPARTAKPTTTDPTVTAVDATLPAVATPTPTPTDGQPTVDPATSPTDVLVTIANTPVPRNSPQATPESTTAVPDPTVATPDPVAVTAIVETSVAATSIPAPTLTPPPSPTVVSTNTPGVSEPAISVKPTEAVGFSPTPVSTPVNPTEKPTAVTTVFDEPAVTPIVSKGPPATPATVSPGPSSIPNTISPGPSTGQVTSTATAGIPASVTPTPTLSSTPAGTAILVNNPTPTAIVAPTPTPTVFTSPSPTALINGAPAITQVSPTTGPVTGGTTVIIKGANFTEGTEITFGGLSPASVTFNNPNQITVVTAPQQAGIVSIVVKNDFGLASLADSFTYTADSVVISQEPGNFNYNGKLTGKIITLKSSFSVGITATGGNTSGWHLAASSTVLSSGSMVIPVENHTIQNVQIITKSGTPSVNKLAYPLIFPVKNATIFSAEPDTGTGETIVTFDTQLVIPPGIPAGNYKLTLNVEVVAGA